MYEIDSKLLKLQEEGRPIQVINASEDILQFHSIRPTHATTGSPKGRETYGDGGPIVVSW